MSSNGQIEEEECNICLGKCSFPVKLECACKTRFCRACLMVWLQLVNNPGCPLCRVRSDIVALEPGDEDYYYSLTNRGYSCMAESEAGRFKDKSPLKEAVRLAISAIKYDPFLAEGYVMLCYLNLLIDNKASGRQYIEKALELDPKNQDAAKLLEYIESEEMKAQEKEGMHDK